MLLTKIIKKSFTFVLYYFLVCWIVGSFAWQIGEQITMGDQNYGMNESSARVVAQIVQYPRKKEKNKKKFRKKKYSFLGDFAYTADIGIEAKSWFETEPDYFEDGCMGKEVEKTFFAYRKLDKTYVIS